MQTESGKPEGALGLGQPSAPVTCVPEGTQIAKRCYSCSKETSEAYSDTLLRCDTCDSVAFCSPKCKQSGIGQHQKLCDAIKMVQDHRRKKILEASVFSNSLHVGQQSKVASLVRDRCIVSCFLNDIQAKVLLDTGAQQVSIMSKDWYNSTQLCAPIHNIAELLDDQDSLRIQWGNGNNIPYIGWCNVDIQLDDKGPKIQVPFVVTSEKMKDPILGFNAIKLIVNQDDSGSLIGDRESNFNFEPDVRSKCF